MVIGLQRKYHIAENIGKILPIFLTNWGYVFQICISISIKMKMWKNFHCLIGSFSHVTGNIII